ncbi:MAG: hypothetical protein R3A79_16315 [Nannocystaceae bacterium]
MEVTAQQHHFADVVRVDADPETRRLLLLDRDWRLHLVDWTRGEAVELPRFTVPDHLHEATQGPRVSCGWVILDMRLCEGHAHVLTTEGLWRCALRADGAWVRVAGHPTDPPDGMTYSNRASFDFSGPLARARVDDVLRRGSSPAVLSPDGGTVVGGPTVYELYGGVKSYTLEMKALCVSAPEPVAIAPALRAGLSALAVSDGAELVAFSEGRELRVIRRGAKRAALCKHNKMFVRGLTISADGRFATASGIYPTDLRHRHDRLIVWDLEGREVIETFPDGRSAGFVGRGEETRLVVTSIRQQGAFATPVASFVYDPVGRRRTAQLPERGVSVARGDTRFLAAQVGDNDVRVLLDVEAGGAATLSVT